jgi:UDP-2,3-diacylglucosamine hydrolase
LADFLSKRSRAKTGHKDAIFLGEEEEWLVIYCREILAQKKMDYFVFGHRHLPLDIQLKPEAARYINLGDWITYYTYAVFDGEELSLEKFPMD